MSSVDDRIVNMQFNNKQFQSGVTESQKSLSGLESSLAQTAKSKGLNDLGASVDGVKNKFGAMRIAGITAVATLATKATSAGLSFVKSLTLDPITQGFQEYQTNLNSIQTVMSNTGLVGEKGMKKVNNALDELNHYSDLTIYNFSEMARNVGTFTAAGVKLKPAVSAIKGIANLAALSGSSSQQASTAMYQLSQAIAAGRVNLQDWNSVVNAGMGGKQFQTALARTAVAMGKVDQKSVQVGDTVKVMGKSFRESIGGQGTHWLDSKILVATLDTLDGRFSKSALQLETNKDGTRKYTDAQIEAKIATNRLALAKKEDIKFTDKQFAAVRKQADAASTAATQVKSLPQLVGVVQESMGSIWSTFFRGVLGTYTQSVNLWTKVGDVVQKGTNSLNNHIIGMVTTWADSGRRLDFINDMGKIFTSLGAIMGSMKGAFDEVFPVHSGQTLIILTDKFTALTNMLTPSKKTLGDLKNIFGGVFAVMHIGISIVSALFSGFSSFFGVVMKSTGGASGGILAFAGHIGQLLMQLDKFLTSGGKLSGLFSDIGKSAGGLAAQGISAMKNWISGMVGQVDGTALLAKAKTMGSNIIDGLMNGLNGGTLGKIKATIENLANGILDWIKGILGIHSPSQKMIEVGQNIVLGLVAGIGGAIKLVLKSVGMLANAILGGIKQMFGQMDALDFASVLNAVLTGALLLTIQRFTSNVSNFVQGFSQVFGSMTATMKQMQNQLKADALVAIAVAVGLLVASVILLSAVKPAKIKIALGAIAMLMAEMVGAFAALSKISKGDDKQSLRDLTAAFLAISISLRILASAVQVLGNMKPETLIKGIGALAYVMGILIAGVAASSKVGPVALQSSAAFITLATAMNIMAGAVALFGHMDIKTLVKGIGAMGWVMGQMALTLAVIGSLGPSTFGAAASIMAMAVAMNIMAGAVALFGNMDPKTLAIGILALGVVLAQMAISLAIVGALGPAGIGAAVAILALAGALVMLVPLVQILGSMDWGTLGKGMLALTAIMILFVAAITALGVVGEVVGPGLLMVGAALALIGVGMLAFGTGFALMAAAGTAGIAVMSAAIAAFIVLLPSIAQQFVAAFVVLIETLAKAAPRMRAAFSTIIAQMLGVVTDAMPQIGKLLMALVTMGIKVLRNTAAQWIEAGFYLIDKLLGSMSKHIPHIVDEVGALVSGFMDAMGRQLPRIADSGAKMIISFLNAATKAVNTNMPEIRNAGLRLAGALINGMTGGLAEKALGPLKEAARKIADALPGWMRKVLGIKSPSTVTAEIGRQTAEGLVVGVESSSKRVANAGRQMAKNLAGGIDAAIPIAVDAAVRMANAVIAAGDPTAAALQGVASAKQKAADTAQARADLAAAAAKKVNAKKSPKLAKKLKAQADAAQKAADGAQAAADAAAQGVQDAKDFAAMDLHAKGDKMNEDATALAESAQRMLAKANVEAAQAAKLQKTNRKAAKAMLAQAQADARSAAALAAQAQASHAQANAYYGDEVKARIAQLEADRQADLDAKKAQAEYDAADNQGKIDILNKRADTAQAKADAANAAAASLIDQAKAKADSDAALAMSLLDQAEAQAQIAKDAADAAKQAKDDAAQLIGQATTNATGGSSVVQPSRSVLEDAASVVDRYTASLAAAEAAAAATQTTVQFVQNNTSPVALTPSEIYRQTNNLLSAQEIKMGANSN